MPTVPDPPSPHLPAGLSAQLAAALATSPDHYLHSFEDGAALFVPMDRAAYRRSIFLDGRISPAGDGVLRLPVTTLETLPGTPAAALPTGWIFHVAHCGSTLLARALEALAGDSALVLREPLALRQLGFAPDGDLLPVVLAQLGKRYPGAGSTIIKANVPVNFLLPEIAARSASAPALFLTMQLDDYLAAILRSDNHRAWLRGITGHFAAELGITDPLGDGAAAAALWLGQMRRFSAALAVMPAARTLDAERFFAAPACALAGAARLFGITTSDAEIAQLVQGPLFGTYSKRPELGFNNAMRLERRAQIAGELGADLAAARAWLTHAAPDAAELWSGLAAAALA
ncbi:MAG: hypothetical protein KGL54_05150 [Sphingomonadales bacterium]|nr:hypothetical protein [Sphingomonadales bacterium]